MEHSIIAFRRNKNLKDLIGQNKTINHMFVYIKFIYHIKKMSEYLYQNQENVFIYK